MRLTERVNRWRTRKKMAPSGREEPSLFGTQTGQAGSGGSTPDEPDAAAAATGHLVAGADQIHRIMKQVDVGSRRAVAEAV